MPDLQVHSRAMDQKADEKWTAEAHLQPPLPKSDRLLGPLAGLLTGLRHCDTPWLLSASCDSPHLSPQLVERLVQAATDQQAEVAVPTTCDPDGTVRHHWVCALIHQHCRASLESALQQGERRVGQWIKSCRWISVSFDDPAAFMNINTLETLHGQA